MLAVDEDGEALLNSVVLELEMVFDHSHESPKDCNYVLAKYSSQHTMFSM